MAKFLGVVIVSYCLHEQRCLPFSEQPVTCPAELAVSARFSASRLAAQQGLHAWFMQSAGIFSMAAETSLWETRR